RTLSSGLRVEVKVNRRHCDCLNMAVESRGLRRLTTTGTLRSLCRGVRAAAWAIFVRSAVAVAVLRFPDEYYDVRWPLRWEDCRSGTMSKADGKPDTADGTAHSAGDESGTAPFLTCLDALRANMLSDLDCTAITPDNAFYLTYDADKWSLDLCQHFVTLFETAFDATVSKMRSGAATSGHYVEGDESKSEPEVVSSASSNFSESTTWQDFLETMRRRTRTYHEWTDEDDVESAGGSSETAPAEQGVDTASPPPKAENVLPYDEQTSQSPMLAAAGESYDDERSIIFAGLNPDLGARRSAVAAPIDETIKQGTAWSPLRALSDEPRRAAKKSSTSAGQDVVHEVDSNRLSPATEKITHSSFPETKGFVILAHPEEPGRYVKLDRPPRFCNTTTVVAHRHFEALVREVDEGEQQLGWPGVVEAIHRRTSLLIENWSMSVLVNFHLWRLESSTASLGTASAASVEEQQQTHFNARLLVDLIGGTHEALHTPFLFVDVGPKRWNVLTHLLDTLLAFRRTPLRMVEVGIDTANSTERLLDTYSPRELELHVGVDPYMNDPKLLPYERNGDLMHEHVREKLSRFNSEVVSTARPSGFGAVAPRSRLLRLTSLEAAKLFKDTISRTDDIKIASDARAGMEPEEDKNQVTWNQVTSWNQVEWNQINHYSFILVSPPPRIASPWKSLALFLGFVTAIPSCLKFFAGFVSNAATFITGCWLCFLYLIDRGVANNVRRKFPGFHFIVRPSFGRCMSRGIPFAFRLPSEGPSLSEFHAR
ncbi:unnamed protein product, partial [Amoebophrya sp. A120]